MSEKQYVIFKLSNEEYGVDIENVQEITEYRKLTEVPNAPDFIEGIINLRGSVTPIVNLKRKFNLQVGETGGEDRIIIIKLQDRQVGFIVDDASQVLTIDSSNIEHPHELITGTDRQYITGIAKTNENIIVMLDLEKILTDREKTEIKNI